MIVYEWADMQYLGKVTSVNDESIPVSDIRLLALKPMPQVYTMAENLRLHVSRRDRRFLHR